MHLRSAENLLEKIHGLLPAPFAVGNIAPVILRPRFSRPQDDNLPDSGIPDEKRGTFTPSTAVTHSGKASPAEREIAFSNFGIAV